MPTSRLQPRKIPRVDVHLEQRLQKHSFAFVVASCREPDMPIVYASRDFYELTGYSEEEVLGKNCRFLQGPRTNRSKVQTLCLSSSCPAVCSRSRLLNGFSVW